MQRSGCDDAETREGLGTAAYRGAEGQPLTEN
jgi:hypothetical protein